MTVSSLVCRGKFLIASNRGSSFPGTPESNRWLVQQRGHLRSCDDVVPDNSSVPQRPPRHDSWIGPDYVAQEAHNSHKLSCAVAEG